MPKAFIKYMADTYRSLLWTAVIVSGRIIGRTHVTETRYATCSIGTTRNLRLACTSRDHCVVRHFLPFVVASVDVSAVEQV